MGFVPKLTPRLVSEVNLLVWWGYVLIVGRKTKVPSHVVIQRCWVPRGEAFAPPLDPFCTLAVG